MRDASHPLIVPTQPRVQNDQGRHLRLGDGPTKLQDAGGRAALDPLRRGRPRPAPLHARARTRRRGRQGRAQDEVALRRALEPLSHVELVLHEGGGELQTVTGVDLVRSHRAHARIRTGFRSALSASRRCCASSASRSATTRLRGADPLPRRAGRGAVPTATTTLRLARALVSAQAPLAVGLSPPPPRLRRLRRRRGSRRLLAAAGGVVCRGCARSGERRISAAGCRASTRSSAARSRRRTTRASPLAPRRDALGVITASYEYHGGFRLRTLRAATG